LDIRDQITSTVFTATADFSWQPCHILGATTNFAVRKQPKLDSRRFRTAGFEKISFFKHRSLPYFKESSLRVALGIPMNYGAS
jgi:hypothetical protein